DRAAGPLRELEAAVARVKRLGRAPLVPEQARQIRERAHAGVAVRLEEVLDALRRLIQPARVLERRARAIEIAGEHPREAEEVATRREPLRPLLRFSELAELAGELE